MWTDTYDLVYLITNFFNISILTKFMHSFFEKRITTKTVCALSYIAQFLVISAAHFYLDIPIISLLVSFIAIFGLTLNYESYMQKRLLISCYILLFLIMPEFIIGVLTGLVHFSAFEKAGYNNSLGLIITKLLTYMEALIFKNFKTARNNKNVTKSEWSASILIPITTIILEVFITQSENIPLTGVVLSLALVYVLNVTAFYLYDSLANSYARLARVAVLEKENELYSRQCEMMQSTTEDLQAFRHDLNNQFIVITELIDKQKYDLAKAQISALSQRTTSNIVYSTTGNIVVDGLINYKLQSSADEHIRVKSEIVVPCDLEIEPADIVTILGNLLDNAIQALKQIHESERSLSIKVVYTQDRLMIQVINPYITEVKYENGEIISSKPDKKQHGFGLKNVERAVEKYDGYMEINHANTLFRTDILLYTTRK